MNKQEKAQATAATVLAQANDNQENHCLNYTSGPDSSANQPQCVKKLDTEAGRWVMTQDDLDLGGDVCQG